MPTTLKKIPIIFLITSIIAFIIASVSLVSTQKFLTSAIKTTGMVKELQRNTDSDGDYVYAPTVIFKDKKGIDHTFTSSFYESIPAYKVGDKVELLYDPMQPTVASINSLGELYMLPLVGGFIGSIFLLIGGGILYSSYRKKQLISWLRQNGQVVKAKVNSVGLNTHIRVNGQSPYMITAQWQEPTTQVIYLFRSESIWFDPKDFVKEEVDVYIDPNNPKRYYMSLANLPQQA